MAQLKEGNKAPGFSLPASSGGTIALKDFVGKKNVVLYFYPKDDTPGCTAEACGFRDDIKTIEKHNAVVLGVSTDAMPRHEKFIEKYSLPFTLLSDEDHAVCEKYGVWVEKNMYGRTYWGVARVTVIIDKAGKIARIFPKVKPNGHSQEVLAVLKNL